MAFFKKTKLYSILTGNCPVCHNESMYSETNPYILNKTLKMQERCSYCKTKYKIEPSFFFGAMYVSYPVGLFFAGLVFVLSYLVFNFSLTTTYVLIVLLMVALQPIIMRLARNIWINFFMSYKEGN
ncbi:DUF983 domain-containing protein [Pontimicrobium sp. MEBiC01747]